MKSSSSFQKGFVSRMEFLEHSDYLIKTISKHHPSITFFFLLLFLLDSCPGTLIQAQNNGSLKMAPNSQSPSNSFVSSALNDNLSVLPATQSQSSEMVTTSRLTRATSTTRKRANLSPTATEFVDSKTTPGVPTNPIRRESGEGLSGEEENDEVTKKQLPEVVGRRLQRHKKKLKVGAHPDKEDYENDYIDQEDPSGDLLLTDMADKRRKRRKTRTKVSQYDQPLFTTNGQPRISTEKMNAKKPNEKNQDYLDDYEDIDGQKASFKAKQQSVSKLADAGNEPDFTLENSRGENNSSKQNTSLVDLTSIQQLDKTSETLDARSPSGQLAAGLGRRINGLFGNESRKSWRTSTTTVTPSSSISSTTDFRPQTTVITNKKSSLLVPTSGDHIVSLGFNNITNLTSTDNLDWSNLVKVVMRSAHDNRTLYTVLMNSSDLADHPISDWSNEMPILLQRDFEKLFGKWSNIFPKELLMEDLRNILSNKPLISSNATNLNETILLPISVNGTAISLTPQAGANLTSSNNILVDDLNNKPNPTDELLPDNSFPVHLLTNSSFTSLSPVGHKLERNNQFRDLGLAMSTPASLNLKDSPTDFFNATIPLPGSNKSTLGTPPTITNPSVPVASITSNKSAEEIMKNMNEEHLNMQYSVKEQMDSLRHFIMLSSVGIVLCTTLVVALVVILNK